MVLYYKGIKITFAGFGFKKLCVAARKIVRRQSWDTSAIRPSFDEDVKKPTNQTKNP